MIFKNDITFPEMAEKKTKYQTNCQTFVTIDDRKNKDKNSMDSDYLFSFNISSNNQNINMCQNLGKLSEDKVSLTDKMNAENILSGDIKQKAENSSQLFNNNIPNINSINCNNIYLYNIFYSFHAF